MIMFKQPVQALDVHIGIAGEGRNEKVMIIKTRVIAGDDPWEKTTDGRIILAGTVKQPLLRLLNEVGRDKVNRLTKCDQYPRGVFSSGSAYDRLRYHLGMTEYRQ